MHELVNARGRRFGNDQNTYKSCAQRPFGLVGDKGNRHRVDDTHTVYNYYLLIFFHELKVLDAMRPHHGPKPSLDQGFSSKTRGNGGELGWQRKRLCLERRQALLVFLSTSLPFTAGADHGKGSSRLPDLLSSERTHSVRPLPSRTALLRDAGWKHLDFRLSSSPTCMEPSELFCSPSSLFSGLFSGCVWSALPP